MPRTSSRTPEIDRYLLRNEVCVALVRRHWAMVAPQGIAVIVSWTVWALILEAGPPPAVVTVATFFYLLSALWFGWILIEWYHEQLAVTDKRLLLVSGLITRKLAVMPLSKVTDMTYARDPWGRLLGYGTFVMESAGQHQALSRIEYVRNPDRLYHRLSQQLFGGGVPSLSAPVEGAEDRLKPVDPLSTSATARLPHIADRPGS